MINCILNKLVWKLANKVPMMTEDPIENYLRNGRRSLSERYFSFYQQQGHSSIGVQGLVWAG